ncbi:hypothetical protein AALO_G00305320 [Alosa alosa]|uniref:Uncharacterized protein n=1 Tax=Alosa alosa TaxID=278164 RepID=A0AAV6FFZ6_9TELE|nr:hypothetical protein AALO_G00305320 [Alosa alosa]
MANLRTKQQSVGCSEINNEFARVTTVLLELKFLNMILDKYSDSLMKMFHSKGGVPGRTIRTIMQPISENIIDIDDGINTL